MHEYSHRQAFFSPDDGSDRVYPVTWNYNAADTPNPVSISVDRHVISMSLEAAGSIFRVYHALTQDWSVFIKGSWRFTAFISPALIL